MGEAEKDRPVHDEWVDQGMCPSIHWTGTWCNGLLGHAGDHFARYIRPPGTPYYVPSYVPSRTTWAR